MPDLPVFDIELRLQAEDTNAHNDDFMFAFDEYRKTLQEQDKTLSDREFEHIRAVIHNWIEVSFQMALDRDDDEKQMYTMMLGFPMFTIVIKIRYV